MPLADGSTFASLDGLAAGKDWDAFVQDATLESQTLGSNSAPDWLNPDFFGTDHLSTIPQADLDMNDFSLDTGVSFGADFDAASGIHAGGQAGLNLGLSGSQFDTFTLTQPYNLDTTPIQYSDNQDQLTNQLLIPQHTSQPFSFTSNQNQHNLFQDFGPNSIFQAPDIASGVSTDDPMASPDSGGDHLASGQPTGDASTEQVTSDHALDGFSPETLRLTQQMLRQASNGDSARPSNDPAANALFEQIMQYKRAGLVSLV